MFNIENNQRNEVIIMFAKTVCKPGAFLSVVHVGLRATLQYSAKGLLEKIFIGMDRFLIKSE